MQILDKVVFSSTEPFITNCLWIRPVQEGVALYIFDGRWKVLKLMQDQGTANPDDDTPMDFSSEVGPDTVGTEQIINNSVMIRDLNDEVKDKLDDIYVLDNESLYINGTKPEEM